MALCFYFRIDGATDNDAFFAAVNPEAVCSYAGVEFRVGRPKWIPDLVKVTSDDAERRFCLTLIELEATERAALVSCRKYLPENSMVIVEAFLGYLDRVIQQCSSYADPRKASFLKLKDHILGADGVTVMTAGGLRTVANLVEELPLIDQSVQICSPTASPHIDAKSVINFVGVLRLSQRQHQALSRSVLIFDAIIRGRDQSSARFRMWRSGRHQPLKREISARGETFPHLCEFVCDADNTGSTVDFDAVLRDLIAFWQEQTKDQHDLESVRLLLTSFYPKSNSIKSQEMMGDVFEAARVHIAEDPRLARFVPPLRGSKPFQIEIDSVG